MKSFSIVGRRYSAVSSSWRFSPFFSDRFERRGLVYVGTNEKISCSIPKTNGDGVSDSKTLFLPKNYQTAIQLDDADLSDSTDATISHRYLWTPGLQDKLLADVTPTETLWTLTDHLGTIRDIIQNTPSGLLVPAHVIYDAYGNVLSCKDAYGTDVSNPVLFGFTGKYFDADTQLQNNINRWYDSIIGRWLSTDPIGFNGADTNLYRYVGNKTIRDIDYLGLEVIKRRFMANYDTHLYNGHGFTSINYSDPRYIYEITIVYTKGFMTDGQPFIRISSITGNMLGEPDNIGVSAFVIGLTHSFIFKPSTLSYSEPVCCGNGKTGIKQIQKVYVSVYERITFGFNPGLGPISFDLDMNFKFLSIFLGKAEIVIEHDNCGRL